MNLTQYAQAEVLVTEYRQIQALLAAINSTPIGVFRLDEVVAGMLPAGYTAAVDTLCATARAGMVTQLNARVSQLAAQLGAI